MNFTAMLMASVTPLYSPDEPIKPPRKRKRFSDGQRSDNLRRIAAADERYYLAFVRLGGKGTIAELADLLDINRATVSNRLPDMEARGKVQPAGVIYKNGAKQHVWRWTDQVSA